MNRLDAFYEVRYNPNGLRIPFEGLTGEFVGEHWVSAKYEITLLFFEDRRKFALLFGRQGDFRPNGMVRSISWKQAVNLIRRNFPR